MHSFFPEQPVSIDHQSLNETFISQKCIPSRNRAFLTDVPKVEDDPLPFIAQYVEYIETNKQKIPEMNLIIKHYAQLPQYKDLWRDSSIVTNPFFRKFKLDCESQFIHLLGKYVRLELMNTTDLSLRVVVEKYPEQKSQEEISKNTTLSLNKLKSERKRDKHNDTVRHPQLNLNAQKPKYHKPRKSQVGSFRAT